MPNINPINISNGTPPTEGWQRPADWLPMPSPSGQTFIGLHAIYSSGNNFVAFRFSTSTGQYEVDWGDGTTTLHDSNTTAEHEYDYATYDTGNATLSTRGYKQAIIVVTPVSGNLTVCNLQLRFTTTPPQIQAYSSGFLDILIDLPNVSSISLGAGLVFHRKVEQIKVLNIGATNMISMFRGCSSLQSVPLFDTSSVTRMDNMFTDCLSLKTVPLFDTSSVTHMISMFSGCSSLQSVPLFDTSSVTFMGDMFRQCFALQSVPLFDTSSVTNMTGMFFRCRAIKEIPNLNTSSISATFIIFASDCNSLAKTDIVFTVNTDINNCQLSREALVNIFNNLLDRSSTSSANININGNWGRTALTSAERDIALNKNWTITG